MILYRPQRGSLSEAMEEVKEFNTIKELFEWLVKNNTIKRKKAFEIEDIYISYYCYDERIKWQTYLVCVGRYFKEDYLEKYHTPQAIGYMTERRETR